MGFFSMGSRVKNKKFDYIPQHYDPAEEDLRDRMSKYGDTEISDAELAKARIRSGIRLKARGNKDVLKKGNRDANIRLFIIAITLAILATMMMQSDAFFRFLDRILT